MYSKLGGCLGETTKLGPLAKTDLCTLVKGLLDRLITHFGLGSSIEEEQLLCLLVMGVTPVSWGLALLVTLESLVGEESDWGACLSPWEIVLPDWGEIPAWELLPDWELLFGKASDLLSAWEIALSAWEACNALSLAECLTAWVAWGQLAWESTLSGWKSVSSAREAWEIPAWESAL